MAVVDDPEGAAERRARITRDLMDKTGIDDAMIERLVRTFYGSRAGRSADRAGIRGADRGLGSAYR